MSRLPREYWVSAVICWSVLLVVALVQAVPYWSEGDPWFIHHGFAYPIASFILLAAAALLRRRYGPWEEVDRRHNLSRRQKVRGRLLIVAGLVPSIVIIIVATAQAGVTNR